MNCLQHTARNRPMAGCVSTAIGAPRKQVTVTFKVTVTYCIHRSMKPPALPGRRRTCAAGIRILEKCPNSHLKTRPDSRRTPFGGTHGAAIDRSSYFVKSVHPVFGGLANNKNLCSNKPYEKTWHGRANARLQKKHFPGGLPALRLATVLCPV